MSYGGEAVAAKDLLPKTRQAEILLVCVTVVWGLTFSMVKKSLDVVPPFVFMSWRFVLAFLVMLGISGKRILRIDRDMLRAGLVLGVFLFGAYAFQTFGLQYTAAGNAGFITGLFVVFTPILSTIILHKKPGRRSIFSVVLATIGLGFLSLQSGFKINLGDGLVLACAFSYSLHIIFMDRYVQRYDLILLTLIQMGMLAVLNTASGFIFEDFVIPRDGYVWLTIVVCGLFASAAAFYIQAWAQTRLSPVRTSVVLIMEPVFSVIFGIILLSEGLSWRGWLGCGLMLAAMLITEARPEGADRFGEAETLEKAGAGI
jgi:drug/metabolite transporter (DMT)-like permease